MSYVQPIRIHGSDLALWQATVATCYIGMGFLKESDCPDGRAVDNFDARSAHFSLVDGVGGSTIGTFRFVPPSDTPHPLPMSEVFDLVTELHQPNRHFELTRLTTQSKGGFLKGMNRNGNLNRSILFHAACTAVLFAEKNGYDGFMAMIDLDMFTAFNRRFNDTLQPLTNLSPAYYEGGWVMPVRLSTRQFRRDAAPTNEAVREYLDNVEMDLML